MTTVAIATERRKLRRELGRLDTVFLLLSAIAVAGTGSGAIGRIALLASFTGSVVLTACATCTRR
jgi:hypothetical protein